MYEKVITANGQDPMWDPRGDASPGVYFYVIEVHHGNSELIVIDQFADSESENEGVTTYTGTFTLIRD